MIQKIFPTLRQACRHILIANQLSLLMFLFLKAFGNKQKHIRQLKVHDKMQKEFITVAAHELRISTQPIPGLNEVLQSKR